MTSLMWAMRSQASAEAMVFSQSLANLRQRPSQAKVRSTTHRRGRTSKPLAASERLMVFRSATLGYYDLTGDKKTLNYGGMRPGCWINALPVGGVVAVPDASAGCRCSYLNRSWITLQSASSKEAP